MDEDDSMEIDDTVATAEIIVNKSPEIIIPTDNTSTSIGGEAPPPPVVILTDDDNGHRPAPSNQHPVESIPTTDTLLPAATTTTIHDDDDDVVVVAEIIDLVPKSVNTKCINYACNSGKDLLTAPGFCLSYFQVKGGAVARSAKEVCSECYHIAVSEYDKMVGELKVGNALFDVHGPLRNDMVEIDDSDEELDGEHSEPDYIDAASNEYICANLDAIISETIQSIDLNRQVENEVSYLNTKNTLIKDSIAQLEEEVKSTRATLDNIQINLYNEFRADVIVAKYVTIVDDRTMSNDILVRIEDPHHTAAQRKSLRNIQKPASYSELDSPMNAPPGSGRDIEPPRDLPAVGLLIKLPAKAGDIYYIARENLAGSWIRARLGTIMPIGSIYMGQTLTTTSYKMTELKKQKERIVDGKHIAYINPSLVRLEMGSRVIAVFKDDAAVGGDVVGGIGMNRPRGHLFYPGVVGEPAVGYNRFRYLIFFDIGYSQYVSYNQVHLVLEVSKNVWEDTHKNCQPFIKKYLESRDRPMVKLSKGQTVKTEYNGKWLLCTVKNVDCSLVQVHFNSLNRTEWIYRGSARLSPMYKEEMAATNRQTGLRNSRKLGPEESNTIVQYTRNNDFNNEDEEKSSSSTSTSAASGVIPSAPILVSSGRAVARKSTTRVQNPAVLDNNNEIINDPKEMAGIGVPFLPHQLNLNQNMHAPGPTTKIMYFTPRDQIITQRTFRYHTCTSKCRDYIRTSFSKLRGHNPLSKPLLCGWARITVKVKSRKDIIYKAPCGRMLRNIAEIHQYLRQTRSEMTVDLFDFNQTIRCLAEFNVECGADPKDLSNGLEQVPIPVINGVNNEKLDFSNYSISRVPMEDVSLNTDPEFLCGCDCEDDCIDKTKCACWRLTLEGAKFMGKNVDPNSIGYIYRRLPESVGTGIYECNSRCKCSKVTCLNRVVQHPMSLKLQVFRTFSRGWGIRAVNDVPQGSFICIYAGTIHTEQMANEDGIAFGDEYFAELDYIEICEQYKQDYESEVIEPDGEHSSTSSSSDPDNDDDDDDHDGRKSTNSSNYYSFLPRKKYNHDNDFVPSVNPFTDNSDGGIRERLRRRNLNDDDSAAAAASSKMKKEFLPTSMSGTSSTSSVLQDGGGDGDGGGTVTVTISDDEDDPKEMLSFNPKSGTTEFDKTSNYVSVRTLFGKDEAVYVMDAKNAGNIGRFLNHSCSPNVFVQNVFVDTHDVRFPCVAFFSSQFIRAGTELTWNYNYDIGSVPGKIMYCHCGSLECKGRLL